MADTNEHDPDTPDHHGSDAERELATEAAVRALAGEVEALREHLEPLKGLDDRLADLADTVTALAGEVAARDRRAQPGGSRSWLDLPDGADGNPPLDLDSVERLLGDLVVWVERVYLRYADAARVFPECWLWHPDVIEELTWLRHAWQCAYQVDDAPPALAWDWHDRYRPGVVRRIQHLVGRCSLDNHSPGRTGTRPGAAATALGVTDLGGLAAWWAGNRHTAPPAPSDSAIGQARDAEAARLRDAGRR